MMRTAHRACCEEQLHFGDCRDVWCFTASLKAAERIYIRTVAAWRFSLSDSSEADIAVVFSLKDCTEYVLFKSSSARPGLIYKLFSLTGERLQGKSHVRSTGKVDCNLTRTVIPLMKGSSIINHEPSNRRAKRRAGL